jgi:hypothetical protein
VFSMSSVPSNSKNGIFCDQLLGYATIFTIELCVLCAGCYANLIEVLLRHLYGRTEKNYESRRILGNQADNQTQDL